MTGSSWARDLLPPRGAGSGCRSARLDGVSDLDDRTCHVCHGQRPAMDSCPACVGRGIIDWIGFCSTPWDEVAPYLSVGCHDYEGPDGSRRRAVVTDEFDVVVSLYRQRGHGPAAGVEHHTMSIPDAQLQDADVAEVERLAAVVADAVRARRSVLVRCQAGLNRSSLVAALALVQLGWSPANAITTIRERRSVNCLFNRSFVAFVEAAGA
jgi:hypothetical protein